MRLKKVGLASLLMLALLVMLALGVTGMMEKKGDVWMMQDMVLGKAGIEFICRQDLLRPLRDVQREDQERTAKIHRAIDLVSRKPVQKSESFIYSVDGTAYYFASDANRKMFAANLRRI